MLCDASKDIESILWEREKHWECQLVEAEKVAEKSNLFIRTFYL